MADITNMPDTDLPKRTAQTLIFFDLESTGLPFTVGRKNVQITELSLIAVDRTEFETSENVRIVNKLNITVQPRSNISFEAIQMTGLCNTSLQFQENFSPSTAQLLQLFFQRLNQPVCLLAHNGRRFDFPVLQAELKNVGATLSDSVYCADTIDAFRKILSEQDSVETNTPVTNACVTNTTCHPEATQHDTDLLNGNIHHQASAKDEVSCTNTPTQSCVQYYDVNALTNDHIDQLLCQGMEIFENLKSKDEPQGLSLDVSHCALINHNSKIMELNAREENIISACVDDFFGSCSSQINEKTPFNKRANTSVISSRYKVPAVKSFKPDNDEKDHSSARRKLFSEDTGADSQSPVVKTVRNKNKMSFSLKNLYHYFFKSDMPLAHFAEADCMSLMKISRELKEFLPWVDEHMMLFNNVRPLW